MIVTPWVVTVIMSSRCVKKDYRKKYERSVPNFNVYMEEFERFKVK